MDISANGATLVLRGDFDARSTFAVRAALTDQLASHEEVIVDLSETQVLDLTALRVLAYASHEAGRQGAHIRLRGCSTSVRRLLHISRLIRVVELERAQRPA